MHSRIFVIKEVNGTTTEESQFGIDSMVGSIEEDMVNSNLIDYIADTNKPSSDGYREDVEWLVGKAKDFTSANVANALDKLLTADYDALEKVLKKSGGIRNLKHAEYSNFVYRLESNYEFYFVVITDDGFIDNIMGMMEAHCYFRETEDVELLFTLDYHF